MKNFVTLYGTPLSLYTGKARSYLIKAGISYEEHTPTNEHYIQNVLSKAGSRTVPTIETTDGEVIRDGTAILDHFENVSGARFSPTSSKQKLLSLLFDVIGAEGLLRPAMHYRWHFPEQNADFVRFHFESMVPANLDRKAMAEKTMARMQEACKAFGGVEENYQLIEALYEELIEKLDKHFGNSPYLLGGFPCIGDFGLIAPLYAHLGRDPAPLQLMQMKAPRLFRWVERMNRPEPDLGEFGEIEAVYLKNDEVAKSIIDLLKHLAEDFVPETRAAASCINQWLNDQSDLPASTPIQRGVGFGSFEVRGVQINALAQPYRFFLLKRVQDAFEALDIDAQEEVRMMLEDCGVAELLNIKILRNVIRKGNLEVWE
ncbi:MAG: glutathione S-transferase [Pseudomonadales bacterium]|nr:glutathione S-transferase [Pseudomonadales bacterium]